MIEKEKRKITIVGPPSSGKTTIVKIFFEMANPIDFLKYSLEPTKGINSSIFLYFNLTLGIFDLAGQENDNWFSKALDIFYESDIIICVFDITETLDLIIEFLNRIFEIKNQLNLQSCNIIILLHKIDLVTNAYSEYVINFIKKQLMNRALPEKNIDLFATSIAENYFFQTFNSISNILNHFNEKSKRKIDKTEFNNLKTELSVIIKCKYAIKYYNSDISNYFNLSYSNVQFHLERLEHLGFISFPIFEPSAFFLTNRAHWFKISLDDEIEKIDQNKLDKGIESFHNFINLNKVASEI